MSCPPHYSFMCGCVRLPVCMCVFMHACTPFGTGNPNYATLGSDITATEWQHFCNFVLLPVFDDWIYVMLKFTFCLYCGLEF